MYSSQNTGPLNERSQERIILVKNEPQVVAVKTEPKPEPADPYGLADLDGITDLLPIQTGIPVDYSKIFFFVDFSFTQTFLSLDFRVDAASLNDLDFDDRYVVTSRPGQLETRLKNWF